jgi:ribosomal protein S18 acetylase RimI-like enzyme
MAGRITIEPVPAGQEARAVRFLAAGRGRDASARGRADALATLLERRERPWRLWWARRRRRCLAAAVLLEQAGGVGFLQAAGAEAPGVDAAALTETVRRLSIDACARGLRFVQALADGDAAADERVWAAAGYTFLAELVYLRKDVSRPSAAEPTDGGALAWRAYGQFDEVELVRVLDATYVGSQDVPLLAGLRTTEQIIAAHKASGEFRAEAWLLAQRAGRPIGCVLVNDIPAASRADVTYLGVVPAARGQGLGRTLLRRAARDARVRGRTVLTLAVDAQNSYARRVYDAEGLEVAGRRRAHVFAPRRAGGADGAAQGL